MKLKLILPLIGLLALGQIGHVDATPKPDDRPSAPIKIDRIELADATPTTPQVHRDVPPVVQVQSSKAIDIKKGDYVLPSVQIDAPSNVDIGDMIVVSASLDKSKASENLQQVKFQWTVIEDGRIKSNAIVWPDGSKIFFAAGMKPKNFVVFLDVDCLYGVAKVVDGATLLADAQVESPDIMATTISVAGSVPDPAPDPTPAPTPDPDPPAPPPDPTFEDGKYKLAAFTYNALKGNTVLSADEKAKLGSALAPSFDGVAAKIAAVSTYTNTTDILTDLKASNVAAIKSSGVDIGKVQAFNTVLGDQIYSLYTSKTMVVASDFGTAFREIATGLKAFSAKSEVK